MFLNCENGKEKIALFILCWLSLVIIDLVVNFFLCFILFNRLHYCVGNRKVVMYFTVQTLSSMEITELISQ